MNQATAIALSDVTRTELERRVRSQTLDARNVRRARIVLLAGAEVGNHEIARRLDISRGQVIAWRDRFAKGGVAAISSDLPGRGVFRSVPELIAAIENYIAVQNQNPKPFIWTAKANDILQKVIRANRKLSSKINEALH